MYDHLSDEEFAQHYEHLFYKQESFKRLQKYIDLAEGRSFNDMLEELAGLREEVEGLQYENRELSNEICDLQTEAKDDN